MEDPNAVATALRAQVKSELLEELAAAGIPVPAPAPLDVAGLERAVHELALGLFAIAAAVNRHTAILERVANDGVKVKV